MSFLRELYLRHERFKRFVHEGMRYPLPPWGQKLMGAVYFSIPFITIGGSLVWAAQYSARTIGPDGELLRRKELPMVGAGNTTIDEEGKPVVIGPGGWGGGVRLEVSNPELQKRNMEQLRKFLRRQQQRQRQQKEREEEVGGAEEGKQQRQPSLKNDS